MSAKILAIEGKRTERASFVAGLTKKNYQVASVSSGSAALERLNSFMPDLVIVDSESMRTSGRRICQSLRLKAPNLPIVLILAEDANLNSEYAADVILVLPFTLQKLLNRIKLLLPIERGNEILSAGPVELDVEQHLARLHGKQASLTPRLVALLQELIVHKGEVIEREELFKRVWDTGYTGDTRTLDVHISWLRQALEDDPRHPDFIKTVRGVGYRLDIE